MAQVIYAPAHVSISMRL